MAPAHNRYLLVDYGIVPVVFNVLLNAGLAWLFFRNLSDVPLWGPQSLALDAVFTCFLLPCIACLIVTPLVRGDVRRGRVPREPGTTGLAAWFAARSSSARKRSVFFGLAGLALAAPVTVALLALTARDGMILTNFVLFKGLFAGALAAIFVPLIAAAALRDAPR